MDSADRARILKLIGMLGSEFAGEQSNAASMLGVMARNNKMTITELVAWAYKPETSKPPPPPPPPPRYQRPHYYNDGWDDDDDDDDGGFHDYGRNYSSSVTTIIVGLGNAVGDYRLNDWERKFVSDVSRRYRYDNSLSTRQREVAVRILEKLGLI